MYITMIRNLCKLDVDNEYHLLFYCTNPQAKSQKLQKKVSSRHIIIYIRLCRNQKGYLHCAIYHLKGICVCF